MYPLVGWKFKNNSTHLLEGRSNSTTAALEWAQNISLFEFIKDSSQLAENTTAENDLSFVNAFNNGVQTPFDDSNAITSFMGLKTTTNKAQMLRAILESIAFSAFHIWESMVKKYSLKKEITIIRYKNLTKLN